MFTDYFSLAFAYIKNEYEYINKLITRPINILCFHIHTNLERTTISNIFFKKNINIEKIFYIIFVNEVNKTSVHHISKKLDI